jgi:hypothetical protein
MMRKMPLLLLFTFLFIPAGGQQVSLSVNPERILIGEHARLILELEVPPGSTVIWPAIRDTITRDIEIIRFGMPDTLERAPHGYRIRQTHTITAWREGFFPVPPLGLTIMGVRDTILMETTPALLEVQALGVDPEGDIRDIKGIIRIPPGLREILPYLLILFATLLIALGLWRYLQRPEAEKKTQLSPSKPDIPAHIAALSSLQGLENKKLWQAGKVKQYHSELSHILRTYIEKRYGLNALEMTTAEILVSLGQKPGTEVPGKSLKQVLELADLVKFARFNPLGPENEVSLREAIAFVEQTKTETQNAG